MTIREVAERAGVSISTVSHAFSGARPISSSTRERVTRAAKELGYEADPSARSLRTGRSGLVGLVLRPQFAVSGSADQAETFNRLIGAVATQMLHRKVGLIHVPDFDAPDSRRVPMDGCLVAHPYGDDKVLSSLRQQGIPVVTIEEDPDRPDIASSVTIDYRSAVDELLDHLKQQGAQTPLLISGTEDNAWNRRTKEAYTAWCRRHRVQRRLDSLSEGLSNLEAHAFFDQLLTAAAPPDTIIVSASDYAAELARSAADHGIRVPEDMMIATLTDTEHSRSAQPPITALDLNHEALAEGAVELVLQQIDAPAGTVRHRVVNARLHVRGSTLRAQ